MASPPGGHSSVLRALEETTDQPEVEDKHKTVRSQGKPVWKRVQLHIGLEGSKGVGRLRGRGGGRQEDPAASLPLLVSSNLLRASQEEN